MLEQLRPRSMISVPIVSSGRIHGALVLVHSDSDRRYGLEDLDLACEIASRAAMTIENAQLFDQAQQATRARDEMLGIVAHDLRNPLSTITMGSSMLLDSALDDTQRRHVQLVSRAAGRMRIIAVAIAATAPRRTMGQPGPAAGRACSSRLELEAVPVHSLTEEP